MDETVLSFAISYIANQIPSVHSLLEKHNGLEARISNCYQKALAKWCSNETIRAKYEHMQNLQDLQSYILGKTIDEGTDIYPLVKLWAEELRNDKLCYDFILENKIDKVDVEVGKIGSKTDEILLNQVEFSSTQAKMMQMLENFANNNFVDKESVSTEFENFLDEVDLLIEKLQVHTALSILVKLERNTIIAQNNILSAKVKYRKGLANIYVNSRLAYELFHQAYLMDTTNESYIEWEIKYLIAQKRIDDALILSGELKDENPLKIALKLSSSKSIEDDIIVALTKIESKPKFLLIVRDVLLHKSSFTAEIDFLYHEEYLNEIETLKFSNILEWLYSIEYYSVKLCSLLPLNREWALENEQYKLAAGITDKFQRLLSKTELDGQFQVIKLLDCFWGYINDGNPNRISEYQSISKQDLGSQKRLFLSIEAALLQMENRTAEAFAIISTMKGSADNALINFSIALGLHSQDVRYIAWALNISVENNIPLDNRCGAILSESINRYNAANILSLVSNVSFENELVKEIVLGLCNNRVGSKSDLNTIKKNIKNLPESILPFAAILLSELNENSLAFEILNNKIDKSKCDFNQRVFINILSRSPEYYPQLYKILKENRLNGHIEDNNLLMVEYNMAFNLADYKNALSSIAIVYERNPYNEDVFINYLNALGSCDRERIADFQDKILSFSYSSYKSVSFVFSVLIQAGYIEFATVFLHNKAKSMDDEQLKRLFFSESSVGVLVKTVSKELDEVQPGVCVIYGKGNKRTAIIIDTSTPLGRLMVGKRKNDIVSFNGEDYTIIAIYPHFYKLHSDYMQNVMDTGGNDFLKVFKINPDENVLETLKSAILEYNPDSVNYQKRKREALANYAIGEAPLSNFVNEDQIFGSYYKLLFGDFKVHIMSTYDSEPIWVHKKKNSTRFVIDLPSIITLFEFSNKYDYKPSEKFLISNYLKEFVRDQKQYYCYNRSCDFDEGITSGSILRFDDNLDKDIEKRLNALSEWIGLYCEPIINDNVLSILGSENSQISLLFAHTMSLLVDNDAILISDDPFYSLKMHGKLPQITTELYLAKTTDKSSEYKDFLFNAGFIGLSLSAEQIESQISKIENNEPNKFINILQTVEKNPFLLVPSINAVLMLLLKKSIVTATLKMSVINLFTMNLKSIKPDFYKTLGWKEMLNFLDKPYPHRQFVKECLLDAKKIVSPLDLM